MISIIFIIDPLNSLIFIIREIDIGIDISAIVYGIGVINGLREFSNDHSVCLKQDSFIKMNFRLRPYLKCYQKKKYITADFISSSKISIIENGHI